LNDLATNEALLSDAGHLVAAVSSFQRATSLLYSVSPDLLIASIRLGAFTGLHLTAQPPAEPTTADHPHACVAASCSNITRNKGRC
jgi:CheY-like chemotaxis protein